MSTKIMQCNCQSEFQDVTYGKGMRVHNISQKKGDKSPKKRCTVCGSVKS